MVINSIFQNKRIFLDKNAEKYLPLPDLVSIQKKSYQWFLEKGIRELLKEFSLIEDYAKRFKLSFIDYKIDEPKFDEIICQERNLTYEAPLKIKIRLTNQKTNKKKEQEIFFCDLPLMTERGTFIINGVERVIIQQLIRSAGVYFSRDPLLQQNDSIYGYGVKIIPDRGSWLELETDSDNIIWVHIDRKRKIAATALLRIFGYSTDEEILALFKGIDDKYISATLEKDVSHSVDEAFLEIYHRIRPGDLATAKNARSLIENMFFNHRRYNLSKVGRYKINKRLGLDQGKNKSSILRKEDLIAVIKEIIRLNNKQDLADDIDHLGNRRIRAVGELVSNRFRIGLMRLERMVKDRMSTADPKKVNPSQLINTRPLIALLRDFFMSSQLSQFMDQTNPLAELEHKRRLSVTGPGGLTKERAGFEVRDVHRTYYGRICPIATPEGGNVGLTSYLAGYACLDEYGFIKTPYRKIKKGTKPKVTSEIIYLDASEEEKYIITSCSSKINAQGYFLEDRLEARIYGHPGFCHPTEVDLIDVSPQQIISIATSLIPFLEHNDGGRALMGTNMQRQAIPCINCESSFVGTGREAKAAHDCGHIILAKEGGKVISVDGSQIKIKNRNNKITTYRLRKFNRSNADTCFNQHPIVDKGQLIKADDPLTDGPCIRQNEIALGQNVLISYLSWEGGNYEDAILISSRLIRDDYFSSIIINKHVISVRDTKLGPEMITRDIPNISDEKLNNLDEDGIIRIGAEVKSGNILVGKITPKGESELSPEEKLLRAIFGEKAKDVYDSSLYLEHGEHGKIVDVKVFSREKGDKLPAGVIKSVEISIINLRKIQVGDKLSGRYGNKGIVSRIVRQEDLPYLEDGTPVDIVLNPLGIVSRMNLGQILELSLGLVVKRMGYRIASPALAGVTNQQLHQLLVENNLPPSGKLKLYDGRTGESFQHEVAVGYSYFMKLNHMVEDKIHQRAIGPYSLITQQPLGGKAQFGGQRFGEMEVWALEGYGAAYTLQEMLTVKSDDVFGRTRAYESIIRQELVEQIGTPDSFNVLAKEIQGLGLKLDLLKNNKAIKVE